jgi:predicted enzyme related to lactoylglutathione lyase
MFKNLRTVIHHVSDLAKAKAWYTQLTGVEPYFDQPFYVGFEIGGCELGLDPDMTGVQVGNHTVAYWSVDDIQAAVAKAQALKAKVVSPVANVGGTTEVAIIEDLWGNQIGFITGA